MHVLHVTRDPDRHLCARLLDAVQGRSGPVYADWLKEQGQGDEVAVPVEHAALAPFRGYRNAIRDELPGAVAVLDAFHVVKLAGNALDEVRRRVQVATLGRRGHKHDPLYRIRRTLLPGIEHLTDRQRARLDEWLPLGDPNSRWCCPRDPCRRAVPRESGPSCRQPCLSPWNPAGMPDPPERGHPG